MRNFKVTYAPVGKQDRVGGLEIRPGKVEVKREEEEEYSNDEGTNSKQLQKLLFCVTPPSIKIWSFSFFSFYTQMKSHTRSIVPSPHNPQATSPILSIPL
ncbi:hypothetical protein KI387_001300, partial [Taxus chinensis]